MFQRRSELQEGLLGGESMFRTNEAVSLEQVNYLLKKGSSFGLPISREEAIAASLGSSVLAVYTAIWMERFFKHSGD